MKPEEIKSQNAATEFKRARYAFILDIADVYGEDYPANPSEFSRRRRSPSSAIPHPKARIGGMGKDET